MVGPALHLARGDAAVARDDHESVHIAGRADLDFTRTDARLDRGKVESRNKFVGCWREPRTVGAGAAIRLSGGHVRTADHGERVEGVMLERELLHHRVHQPIGALAFTASARIELVQRTARSNWLGALRVD